ncbi:Phage anti-repressor protein [Macrococcoides caseolyticum]|nr:Phage anti-repressor protein [Macrococcus caseolyticus]
MNKLKTNNQLVPVQENENGEVVVSGRMLHKALEVKTQYKDWFPRMTEYGFVEGSILTRSKLSKFDWKVVVVYQDKLLTT